MSDSARRAARRTNLKRLLAPRHVAFIGGHAMEEGIDMLRLADFPGEIWPVNPKYDRIAGLPVFGSVAELPEGPDAAFLYVPKTIAAGMLGELAASGGGGAVCFAAGYAEINDQGRKLQELLAEAAGDLAVFGPNSNGFLNYLDRTALWPVIDHRPHRRGRGIAVVSSSSGVLFNYSVSQRSVEAAILIGLGNQAVCDFGDCIDVLADDSRVTAMGIVAEDLGDIPSFNAAAAKALSRNIPVIAIKSGTSETGAILARTHSGALAVDDRWVDALFERCGVIRVHSLPELDETLKMVTTTPIPRGPRLAILTNSGGEKALAADATVGLAMDLAQPSEETRMKLATIIPDFATVSNPFDYNAYYTGSGRDILAEDNPAMLEHCFRTMIGDGYDIAMMMHGRRTHPDGTLDPPSNTTACWIAANQTEGRSVVQCATMPEHMPECMRSELISNRVAPLQGLKEALTAIDGAIRWGMQRDAPIDRGSRVLPAVPPLEIPGKIMDEGASRRELAARGLVVAHHEVVAPGEAAAAADRIGYPVALKAVVPVIAHKASAGAVVLDLALPAAVAEAANGMAARFRQAGTPLEKVMVEAMVKDPVHELIAGITFDRRFGHALVYGRGGSNIEHLNDVTLCLLPATRVDLERVVRSRGFDEAVVMKITAALEAITRYTQDNSDRLVSLDVNPLIVTGTGDVVAVDILIETAAEMRSES